MVKPKVKVSRNFKRRRRPGLGWLLPAIAILTFGASWFGVFPPTLVERWYARSIFRIISGAAEKVADSISFSWFDLAVPGGVILAVWLIRGRRWKLLLNRIATIHLI